MKKMIKTAAIALAATGMAAATPASATIFEYVLEGGDVLTIDNESDTATWTGQDLNVEITSPDFLNFQGGDNPTFMTTITAVRGSRLINGNQAFANTASKPFELKAMGDNRFNLWGKWTFNGTGNVAGDYHKAISGVTTTDVPAPGMLGLFGMALAALGLGWRRRRKTAAAA